MIRTDDSILVICCAIYPASVPLKDFLADVIPGVDTTPIYLPTKTGLPDNLVFSTS